MRYIYIYISFTFSHRFDPRFTFPPHSSFVFPHVSTGLAWPRLALPRVASRRLFAASPRVACLGLASPCVAPGAISGRFRKEAGYSGILKNHGNRAGGRALMSAEVGHKKKSSMRSDSRGRFWGLVQISTTPLRSLSSNQRFDLMIQMNLFFCHLK